jgi:hypothetical protein
MDQQTLDDALAGLIERLAAIEHQRWSHWQTYVHSKGTKSPDGSLVLPADLVERWERQIATPYSELEEKEKQSDRDQVQRYLRLLSSDLALALSSSERSS